MNNILSNKFSGFFGGLMLVTGLCAPASALQKKPLPGYPAPADFSDKQLTPNSNPPAAVGNDLLLAEGAGGPDASGNYAENWTTILYMSDTNPGAGTVDQTNRKVDVFDGKGPTGTYAAGTIGDGKHTENTLADIHVYFTAGGGDLVYYQYVVTDTVYGSDGSARMTTIGLPVNTYDS